MKNLKTLSTIVNDGKVILNLPEFDNGTKLELGIISTDNMLQQQTSPLDQEIENQENAMPNTTTFEELGLMESLLQALAEDGFKQPTPIQIKAIPGIIQGRDMLANAQTGSGKTAAFTLPIIQHLAETKPKKRKYPRALILSPTRELANQIGQSIATYAEYTGVRFTTIYGGVSPKQQVRQLRRGKDMIIATPGRLLDLINQGIADISQIETFVLDEADRMLDIGFIREIEKIIEMIPEHCQTLLFSATIPPQIVTLAKNILINPQRVSVDPPTATVDSVKNSVYFVEKADKYKLLTHLLEKKKVGKALVFMRTKHSANKTARRLEKNGISADAIHGDKSQAARERALQNFKTGRAKVLVATDVASRGIDVADITHVINYDMSSEAEVFIHRVGRTARAGKSGVSYNFCAEDERENLIAIERLIKKHIHRVKSYPFKSPIPVPPQTDLYSTKRFRTKKRKSNRNERAYKKRSQKKFSKKRKSYN